MKDLALMIAAFAAASVVALAAGTGLGEAFTYGQLAFAAALAFVLLRR